MGRVDRDFFIVNTKMSINLVEYYNILVRDKVRTDAFEKAIMNTVKRDDYVIDIGTGTGILAAMAAEAGASRVTAIEGSIIAIMAKKLLNATLYEPLTEVVNINSSLFTVSGKADVVIGELLGYFGALDEGMVPTFEDARKRMLKEGGTMIPSVVFSRIALCGSERVYNESYPNPMAQNVVSLDNICVEMEVTPEDLVSTPVDFAIYSTRPDLYKSEICKYNLDIPVNKDCTLYGVVGWFDAILSPDVVLSTSPWDLCTHWGQCFFPLKEPVQLRTGETYSVSFDEEFEELINLAK